MSHATGPTGPRRGNGPKDRLTVLEPGPLTLVEDLGRPGHASVGVGRSGALDRGALRLANRLVGNRQDAAGLEILLGPARVRFDRPIWFAVTGAWGDLVLDGDPVEPATATRAEQGAELRIGAASAGLRFYLAVQGGLEAEPVLGSRSTDMLSGLGPAAVIAGTELPLGTVSGAVAVVDAMPVWAPPADTVTIRVHPGPRADWFAAPAVLGEREWQVSADSNRVGLRLEGEPLARRDPHRELQSEGMVAGAIQVPPSGLPTILLADHPVTGGYPVIAVVADASLDALAQLRPGQRLAFRHATRTLG